MNREDFRRQLRDESHQWRQEGLIEPNFYEILAERYTFADLSEEPHNRFVGVLLGLGGILLGLGAITLVAANWQAWSRLARVILLLSLFFGVNSAGFYLWRNPQKRSRLHRLGHGLLLTGGLILGANLGLMSQMFHQSGPIYQLYFIWSLGVLVMAYSLRLTSLGILSWILMMLSYFTSNGASLSNDSGFSLIQSGILYLPVLISVFYLPLAHWLRSRWLYGLWGVSFMIVFGFSPFNLMLATFSLLMAWGSFSPMGIAMGTILPAAVLWVYRFDLGRTVRQRPQLTKPDLFQSVGRSLSIWSVSFTLYLYAFRFPWQGSSGWSPRGSDDVGSIIAPLAMLLVYLLFAAYGWWRAFQREPLKGGSRWLTSPLMAILLVSMFGFAIACHSHLSLTIIGPAFVNLLMFGLSIVLIHDGLLFVVRRRFWGGMFILVMGLVSRMFEYNTGLTLKALVLSLCGLGIIAAGLWFEYRVKPPVQASLPESLS